MCLTEFDEVKYNEIIRKEALEEGLEKGREETREENIITVVTMLKDMGKDDGFIIHQLTSRFNLDKNSAKDFLEKV